MNYLKNKDYFCIDGHCHFSPENAHKVIPRAMNKGLDALAITEYTSITAKPKDRYRRIVKNKDEKENPILPSDYIFSEINEYSSSITRKKEDCIENLILFNSQEINTLEGHVLALCTSRFYEVGLPIEETIHTLTEEDIPFVLPHPYSKMFEGVGEEKVLEIYEQFPKAKFALEDNGQASWLFRSWNKKAYKLAKDLNLAIVGFSDGHLDYPLQWLTTANLYSAISRLCINKNNLKESISEMIKGYKKYIKIGGVHRSTLGVGFWIACTPKTSLGTVYCKFKEKILLKKD